MKSFLAAVAGALVVAAPAAAQNVQFDGGGFVQSVSTRNGGTTTLTPNTGFNLSFAFDPGSLTLIGSDATSAGYRFDVSDLQAQIGDYAFQPASTVGVVSFARAFAFFDGPSSEQVLIQNFSFSGLATGAPFALPGGLARTSLSFTSTFRYGDNLPPIDASALTDPLLAARGNFTFSAVPNGGAGRASVFGPASASFTFATVPEPSTWAILILGFGAVGGAMRRRGVAVSVAYR